MGHSLKLGCEKSDHCVCVGGSQRGMRTPLIRVNLSPPARVAARRGAGQEAAAGPAASRACPGARCARSLPLAGSGGSTVTLQQWWGSKSWFSLRIKSHSWILFFCNVAFVVRSGTLLFCLFNNIIYQLVLYFIFFFYIHGTPSYAFAFNFYPYSGLIKAFRKLISEPDPTKSV